MSGFRHRADRVTAALSLLLISAGAQCAASNQPQKPFRIYGNTYYVGTAGHSSVLVTSAYGHVLIDAGLPESAPAIANNVKELGFEVTDIKAILSARPHVDHAGGIAELQRLSGAPVYALRAAEQTLRTGKLSQDDPQYAARAPAIPPVSRAWVVQDDQLLGVGGLRLRVLATPGPTPGSASWTWDACEGSRCLRIVYADSLTPVAAGRYRFRDHPDTVKDFESSFARLESVSCDLLLTTHPDAQTLARLQQAEADADKLKDDAACKRHAQQGREALQARLASER